MPESDKKDVSASTGNTDQDTASGDRPMELKLFIAGSTPNSMRAKKHLQDALNHLEQDRYTLEIINCFQEPQKALANRIIVTPTLLKHTDPSPRMLVGNLGNAEELHAFLGIED